MDLSKIKSIPTQESIQKEQEIREALRYLSDTDWLAVRKIETGKEIPEGIAEKRAQARDLI